MKFSKHTPLNDRFNKQFHMKRGFTLIELLVVIAIIATLSAIGFGTFFKIREGANEKETSARINAVAAAMVARSEDITSAQRADVGITNGLYPIGDGLDGSTADLIRYISGDYDGDEEGEIDDGVKTKLPEVVVSSANRNSFIKEMGADNWLIVDSWNTPLHYTFPGIVNNYDNGFDLESAGPDRDFSAKEDNIILE